MSNSQPVSDNSVQPGGASVIIKDSNGTPVVTYTAVSDESIATQAQDEGAPIPISCGVGACRTCVATVESGLEWIDTEAVGPQQIPVEDNEVLTCICAVKPDAPANATISLCCQNL